MKTRNGENMNSWLRCNRFYNLKGQWFFSTREGIDFGPFATQDEAKTELQQFIQRFKQSTLA
jgi:hypothetical protein